MKIASFGVAYNYAPSLGKLHKRHCQKLIMLAANLLKEFIHCWSFTTRCYYLELVQSWRKGVEGFHMQDSELSCVKQLASPIYSFASAGSDSVLSNESPLLSKSYLARIKICLCIANLALIRCMRQSCSDLSDGTRMSRFERAASVAISRIVHTSASWKQQTGNFAAGRGFTKQKFVCISHWTSKMPLSMSSVNEIKASTRDSTFSQEGYSDTEILSRKIAKVEKLLRKCGRDDPNAAKWKKKRGQYIQQLGELAYGIAKSSQMLKKSRQSEINSNEIMPSPTSVTTGKLAGLSFNVMDESMGNIFEYSDPNLSLTESDSSDELLDINISEEGNLPNQPCEWIAFENNDELSQRDSEPAKKKNHRTYPPTREASVLDFNLSATQQILSDAPSDTKKADRDSTSKEGASSANQLRAIFERSAIKDSTLKEESEQCKRNKKITKLRAMFDVNANNESTPLGDRHDGEAVKKLRAMFDIPSNQNKRTDNNRSRKSWNQVSQQVSKVTKKEIIIPDLDDARPMEEDEKSLEITSDIDSELKAKLKRRSQMHFSAPAIFAAVGDNKTTTLTSSQDFQSEKRVSESVVQNDKHDYNNSSVHELESNLVVLIAQPNSCKNQLRALTILQANGFSEPEIFSVDGTCPHQKSLRNELFAISGLRGVYPQLFVRNAETNNFEFFGDFDKIEILNDCDQLRHEIEKSVSTS